MTHCESPIRLAVRRALLGSAMLAGTSLPAQAQDQDQGAAARPEEVVVTGTRIRRVDEETASPVFVIDATAITNSGIQTLGELVQRVPAVSGAATNPQVNNGGGTGESNIELRGLSAQRTLVLLNGRRIGILGNTTTSAVDINIIPINLIERVEILKEGAGAIYGSDAIAGVVNFITKRHWDGAEFNAEFGRTGENDGEREAASFSWGVQGDQLSVLFGGNYNKQDAVSANDRDYSRFALYLYGGVVSAGGSSRTPTGRVGLPAALAAQLGCANGTRIAGQPGTSVSDYRCFTADDAYNYQPFNLLLTPQERGSLFTLANYALGSMAEGYAEFIYNRTRSGFEIAPLPFDAVADDTVISAASIFNPFGTDFGGVDGLNPNLRTRLEALGTRHSEVSSDSILFNVGLRGAIGGTQWRWDANAGIGRLDQDTDIDGYLLKPALQQAVGPSFIDAGGTPRCGTPAAPIAGCTPINIFNVQDPAQVAALRSIQSNYRTDYQYRSRNFSLNVNGPVLELPAGAVQAAIGAEYREQEGVFETDILTRGVPPLFLSCLLAQETCTGNSSADYDVQELYAELFLPLLAERPFARALNLSAGVRWSDYSRETIGSSTNAQLKLEYRPVADLLVRGSFAEVFRAPTIVDLSLAPSQTAPTFTDPCTNLTSAQVAANPNLNLACVGVPRDAGFTQPQGQITGLLLGNQSLEPESGDVLTFGFVYDVSQVRGLSFTVDFWRYDIEDIITNLDPNFAAQQCVATGDPAFCGLMFRYDSGPNTGEFQVFQMPTVNLGELRTDGVDLGVKYALRSTPLGSFNISLDMTRIGSYESTPAPGAAPVEIAGTYDRQFGNYARWRGLLGVGWAWRGFDGLLTARYVHSLELRQPDGALPDAPPLDVPSFTYVDLTLGYTFPSDTKVQLGVLNITDKQPPILYQNNVLNANTDVSTYDTIGRRWYVGFTQRF